VFILKNPREHLGLRSEVFFCAGDQFDLPVTRETAGPGLPGCAARGHCQTPESCLLKRSGYLQIIQSGCLLSAVRPRLHLNHLQPGDSQAAAMAAQAR
jgi:hypothetical protein